MSFSRYLAHTNPLFLSMEVLSFKDFFLYKVRLIMYNYSNKLLPECNVSHYYISEMIVSMNTILGDVIN